MNIKSNYIAVNLHCNEYDVALSYAKHSTRSILLCYEADANNEYIYIYACGKREMHAIVCDATAGFQK